MYTAGFVVCCVEVFRRNRRRGRVSALQHIHPATVTLPQCHHKCNKRTTDRGVAFVAVTSPYARAVLLVPPRAPGTCALLGTEHRAQPLRRQSNSERRSIVYRSCPDVSPIVSPSVQVCTAGTGWGGGVGGGAAVRPTVSVDNEEVGLAIRRGVPGSSDQQ